MNRENCIGNLQLLIREVYLKGVILLIFFIFIAFFIINHEKLASRGIDCSYLRMSRKVLVVDDEESILKGIKLNLGRKFDLTLSNGPEQAQQLARKDGPYDVVVSDMRMPVMDGASLMRKLKEENPETLCILLTGHADFEFGGSQALQSGQLFKILNKPCNPDKLGRAIQAAFDKLDGKEPEEEKVPSNVI